MHIYFINIQPRHHIIDLKILYNIPGKRDLDPLPCGDNRKGPESPYCLKLLFLGIIGVTTKQ